jgi:hypothetical protein
MFDKVSEAAEKLATTASRREFMGWLGRSAAAVAAVLGGLCAASLAHGRPPRGGVTCCYTYGGVSGCTPPQLGCKIVKADCTGCLWKCNGVLMTSPCSPI